MRVVLIIEDDSVARRTIAEAFLRAGYGVCETYTGELVPAVPRLDAVISDAAVRVERSRAPIVAITRPLDVSGLLAQVHQIVSEEPAA